MARTTTTVLLALYKHVLYLTVCTSGFKVVTLLFALHSVEDTKAAATAEQQQQ
jgi:hypothetical protein